MRKLICAVALLVVSALIVPAAMAGTVSLTLSATSTNTAFTISGIYAPGTPSIPSFSGPDAAYSLSFTVLTNGSANSGFVPDTTDGIFFVNADMTLAFGGSTTNLGTLQVEFDNTLNGNVGGLFFCVAAPATCPTDAASWSIVGPATLHRICDESELPNIRVDSRRYSERAGERDTERLRDQWFKFPIRRCTNT